MRLRKIKDRDSRIITMLRTMLFHQIMRQLMRHHNPPPTSGLHAPLARAELDFPRMQLLEEAEIAKHAPLRVERDSAPDFIVEYMQRTSRKTVYVANFV